ncbi:MAG TPA: acetate/propionate family kinase [Phototrophicaceae bacterium]|nr:acetate/propionate family kinase [Phototrophicaceae bacterium]
MSSILTLNGGSSSLKFALFEDGEPVKRLYSGQVERIGSSSSTLRLVDHRTNSKEETPLEATNHGAVIAPLLDRLKAKTSLDDLVGVGHRIVHGGERYRQPSWISDALLNYLQRITPYDPEHLPSEIAIIRAIQQQFPKLRQAACFDTAFHGDMPIVARLLPIPRRYFRQGVQRYGFHGLSYTYLMSELQRISPDEASGRVILAHLGNGASMAAVRDGKSIDTSMAFTPTAGLVMGTRTGDIDPGAAVYLARTENMSPQQFYQMANFESGMLGVSEASADMRDLLGRELADTQAAEAVSLFCYSARKMIGAYAAALSGLDTLVFAGGIGENSAAVRARICEGLEFLGIRLDSEQNDANADNISSAESRVHVRVIHTDEELQIAQTVKELLG